MKFIKTLLIIILSSTIVISEAQQTITPRQIGIGEKIPQAQIQKIFPESLNINNIQDEYKKGTLIINFWASWCVPCVKELQLLAKMKKKYPQKLSILSITHESGAITKAFLQRHPEIDISAITIINDDKFFSSLFPHRYLPHNVWIDSTGTIRAITSGEEMNETNIESAIRSAKYPLKVKSDNLDFDYSKPYTPNDSLYIYRSSLSKGVEGIGGGIVLERAEQNIKRKRIFGWNCSIAQLYWMTYFNELNTSSTANYNFIALRSKDSLKLREPENLQNSGYISKKAWRIENTYSYELKYAIPVPQDSAFTQMRSELNRYFKYHTFLELAERDVLVLKVNQEFPKSLGGKKFFEATANGIRARNITITDLIGALMGAFTIKTPIVDESKIEYTVDIDIVNSTPEKGFNFLTSTSLWEKIGISFIPEKRKVKILVIADH